MSTINTRENFAQYLIQNFRNPTNVDLIIATAINKNYIYFDLMFNFLNQRKINSNRIYEIVRDYGDSKIIQIASKIPIDYLGNFLIHKAVDKGDINFVKRIVEANVDLNTINNNQLTPLNLSINIFQHDIAEILVESGANPNISDALGDTPLILMSYPEPNYRLFKNLLDAKADVNHQNISGISATNIVFDHNEKLIPLLCGFGSIKKVVSNHKG